MVPPRLLVDNITPEALVRRMVTHGERLSMYSDEGGIFKVIGGLYSRGVSDYDLIKKAWDGSPHTVDRSKSDEFLELQHPLLVVGLTVQPHVVEEVTRNREFRATGLVGRFLWALPVSRVGHRSMTPPEVAPATRAAFSTLLLKLLDLAPAKPVRLRLSLSANEAFTAFRSWLVNDRVKPRVFGERRELCTPVNSARPACW